MTENRDDHLYWGVMHCHVSGALCHKPEPFSKEEFRRLVEQIEQLMTFARDERGLDFISYADHQEMGGMIGMGDVPDSPWRFVREKNEQFNEPGKFVTIDGYEYQDGSEYNVYLHKTPKLPLADKWRDLIEQVDDDEPGIILAAHNRPCPTDWNFRFHPNFRLIEVINDGGVFEAWTNAGLKSGHRGGFYAGSDDHGCHPARFANTGAWAETLTRDAVWEAWWNRRTIAAIGVRPRLAFSLNESPMGSEIVGDGARFLRVSHAAAPRPLACLFIKNGRALRQFVPEGGEFSEDFKDDVDSGEPFDYYYVKTIYPDGAVALTSPVWVGRRSAAPRAVELNPRRRADSPPPTPSRIVAELGERVGYHCFINASHLVTPAMRWASQARDMVSHVGPEGILVSPDGSVVCPDMDGIAEFRPDGVVERLLTFGRDDEFLLVTAIVENGDAVLAAGYRDGEPALMDLRGGLGDALAEFDPIKPYFFGPRVVTPKYLASDGAFMYCLAPRECLVATPVKKGRLVATCQDGFPAFPIAVDAISLAHVFVLSCDRSLVCYDASATQKGRVRWRVELPRAFASMAAGPDGVWVFNEKIENLSLTKPIEILRIDLEGKIVGALKPDLINIRGAALVRCGRHRFAAIHNPDTRASAIYRKELNVRGRLRIYQIESAGDSPEKACR